MAKTKKRGAPSNIALDASKQKEFNQTVKRVSNNVKEFESVPGVVYISHLPWGFEEKPLRQYFKQFGAIKQLRVSRSKKTGNSRGYAYIQFDHDEVAKIVADTMNNYLMFGKLIKCKHLQKPHPETFKNANRPFFKPKFVANAISKHNCEKSDDAVEKSQKKMMSKLSKLQAKLESQGIKYKFEDPYLKKVKEGLKEKAEAKKLLKAKIEAKRAERKKRRMMKKLKKAKRNDDDGDSDDDGSDDDSEDEDNNDDDDSEDEDSDDDGSDDDNDLDDDDDDDEEEEDDDEEDDDDDDDDEEDDTEVLKTPVKQQKGQKTVKNVKSKLISKGASGNKNGKKTAKRQSLIPKEVDTPKGKMNVLIEDSSEDEVSFKTPPNSIKSSKLPDTIKSVKGTPKTAEKRSPKRKFSEMESKRTATLGNAGKKIKLTPGITQKKGTPRTTEKKSQGGKLNEKETEPKRTATPGNTGKKVKLTPGNNQKKGTPRTTEKKSQGGKLNEKETEPERTATPGNTGKKIKLTPGKNQKKGTPRTTEKKSQERTPNEREIEPERTATPGNTGKKLKLTPGNSQKNDSVRVGSAKKKVGSAKKKL